MKVVKMMQRYFTNKKENNDLILNEYDTHHISKVMRMSVGDLIEVVYQRQAYECEIEEIGTNVRTKPQKILQQEEVKPKKILLLPLLKEQKMDLVLQKTTELGIDEIQLIYTERSVVKLDAKKITKKLERWQMIMKEASEQSKRLTIPRVRPTILKLVDLIDEGGIKLMCSTRKPQNNIKLFLQNHKVYDKIFIAVGPEGGFTLQEEDTLIQKGFSPVTLGKSIMRVETAPLFCLSVLLYESME